MNIIKICTHCFKIKSENEFHKYFSKRDDKIISRPECIECEIYIRKISRKNLKECVMCKATKEKFKGILCKECNEAFFKFLYDKIFICLKCKKAIKSKTMHDEYKKKEMLIKRISLNMLCEKCKELNIKNDNISHKPKKQKNKKTYGFYELQKKLNYEKIRGMI